MTIQNIGAGKAISHLDPTQRTVMLGPLLQYQSLKTVLQHMDANVRFQISLRMPLIRTIEKTVPLKINRLEIRDVCTTVNDTSYQLGIVRYYHEGNTPELIKEEQQGSGFSYDLDKFGVCVKTKNNVLLPGDVILRSEGGYSDSAFGLNWTDDVEEYREDLRVHEKALEILTELESKGQTVDEYIESLKPISRYAYGEQRRIREALRFSSEHLIRLVKHDRLRLIPFDCRDNKIKPPFSFSIQLTIKKGESKQIQRFEYNRKLFEAFEHLNEVFFEGRLMPILVDHFYFYFFNNICRVPVGFRLRVRHAHTYSYTVTHRGFSMLVENSDNLDSLWFSEFREPGVAQLPIIRNANVFLE